jgi:hypothetical protein
MAEPMNGQRPPMPDMAGANMRSEQGMTPEANMAVMKPSAEIGAVLMARLGALSEEQLEMFDRVITPEAARALLMLLPELEELLLALDGIEEKQEPEMGALGGMG